MSAVRIRPSPPTQMDFALDDEQALLVATLRRWSERELRGWAADADRAAAPPAGLWKAAGELGLLVDAVPEAAGGMLDGAYSHLGRALRGYELGRGCAALAALIESNVEPALAVARWGSQAAQGALFAALAGGRIAVFVHDFYERLSVAPADARGGLTVSGTLGPLPGLAIASHALVAAGGALFLVALPAGRAAAAAPSGWRAAAWGSLELERFAVEPELVLSGAAFDEVLAWFRVSLAARALGVAAAAIEHAAAYAEDRIQFGQPIGRFQSLARMRDANQTAIAAARAYVLMAAWEIDRGAASAGDTASRARDLAAEVVTRATIEAVQIFGGYGFVNDFPVEKLMRDARAFEVLGGNEALARVLAQTARGAA
ncbi:MAG TPA: acyl-CoA dehydrogenase family protein [Kofleriaceae bacterium]|nr:acyl-CoA dehydrogenase family protein [Kofleriaceae bacterium]